MKQLIFIVFTLVLLTGCEKEIDLKLDNKSGTIVIEGNITDQPGPYYVRITKSVSFTTNNQYPPITNVVVTISDDNGQSETLQYVSDGLYKTTNFISTPGRTYTLKAKAEGVEYFAKSTMPLVVSLDSLTQDSFSFGGDVSYNVLPVFTDPVVLGNRYLFAFSVNSKKDKTFEVFSDNINNGMANQRSLFLPNDDDDKVVAGDSIHVEMQCIDPNIYTYYTALIQISGNSGLGGSVTPANPPGNIRNGALGYFAARTSAKKTIVIR